MGDGRMAKGGHGIPKVSLGPVMPEPSTPYGRFWGGRPASLVACARLLPIWTPHAVRLR
jgi:hypothetical protein